MLQPQKQLKTHHVPAKIGLYFRSAAADSSGDDSERKLGKHLTILVTGARGMIGSVLVRELLSRGFTVVGVGRSGEACSQDRWHYFSTDLADKSKLQEIIESMRVDRVIHLAALAHREGQENLTWERYQRENVECARNVFSCAGSRPVLFISTIDVYGFFDGCDPVTAETIPRPVSDYGKSKLLAEQECQKLPHYTIFRLSPVYTPENTRDIQKRYYLRYPRLAYQVGKGSSFEVLNVELAAKSMADWCSQAPQNDIRILKDPNYLWTPAMIQQEQQAGRASLVLHVPVWCVSLGYGILKAVLGENEKTYLLNKLVHPLRTRD